MQRLIYIILISFLIISPALAKSAIDPAEIGVGARSLGMGKAFIGLADDASAIFTNPAGTGNFQSMQFVSMQTNLLGEYQYIVLGDAYPTKLGTFGIGYIGINSGESPITARNATTNRIEATGQNMKDTRGTFLLTWGKSLNEKTALGTGLKLYSANISHTNGGSASGYNLDLGILHKTSPWVTVGASLQNLLPSKLTWATGTQEDLPTSLKLGSAVKMCGKNGYLDGIGDLTLLADTDIKNEGSTLHLGGEWLPVSYLSLRAGLDCSTRAIGNSQKDYFGNLVGGVGINLGSWNFDFAFHGWDNLSENNTYFFSLRYSGDPFKGTEKSLNPRVEIMKESIVYVPVYSVPHVFHNPIVKSVKVNEKEVKLSEGQFYVNQPLRLGKNQITIEMFDAEGHKLYIVKRDVIRLVSFKDLRNNHWAKDYVEKAAAAGIVSGYADGTFQPDKNVTRAEFSKLLVGLSENIETSPTRTIFQDVRETHWASGYIQNAAQLGLIQGYPNKTFKPNKSIKTGEGIAIIVRLAGLDISKYQAGKDWTFAYLAAAKDAGIIDNTSLSPDELLTRDQAIAMLCKTNIGKQIIARKLNLEEALKIVNL